jgi:Family of unknown function (DUF6788)
MSKRKKDVSQKELMPENKSDKMLPKNLPASVCAQYVRCGKRGCRCGRGELHGPYHYCFWREGGRLRKAYIKKADVEQVRNTCMKLKNYMQQNEKARQQWRGLQALTRLVEGILAYR